jgi:hypothetical protein
VLFFGVAGFKAAVVAMVILIAIMGNYGRRTLIRGGIVVLFLTLGVRAEIFPDPTGWSKIAHFSVTAQLR